MTKHKKTYQHLREEFSDEEIADSYVFPNDLDQKEKEEIEEEFKKLRLKSLRACSGFHDGARARKFCFRQSLSRTCSGADFADVAGSYGEKIQRSIK